MVSEPAWRDRGPGCPRYDAAMCGSVPEQGASIVLNYYLKKLYCREHVAQSVALALLKFFFFLRKEIYTVMRT